MKIKIGKSIIGDKKNCFIVAEMSGNHNGDIKRAIEIVRAAKKSGADAIKIQTYTADTITIKSNKKDFLLNKGSPWKKYKNLWNLYNHAHTPLSWHKRIFKEAKKLNMEYFSSPFDESSVDFLETLGVSAYKVASPEINHIPLLKKIAKTKKPVIISSGLSNLKDLDLAISTLRKSGSNKIVLLKCNSSYPSPIEESNIITISDIPKRFNVLSGLSDHTHGYSVAIASVALGASIIEKHFTLNDSKKTVDSFFSLKENNFKKFVKSIRLVEKSLGKINYDISKSAKKNINSRRSIYVFKHIKKGEKISKNNIKIVRPGYSLEPKYYYSIIGKRVKKELHKGDRLTFNIIDDCTKR